VYTCRTLEITDFIGKPRKEELGEGSDTEGRISDNGQTSAHGTNSWGYDFARRCPETGVCGHPDRATLPPVRSTAWRGRRREVFGRPLPVVSYAFWLRFSNPMTTLANVPKRFLQDDGIRVPRPGAPTPTAYRCRAPLRRAYGCLGRSSSDLQLWRWILGLFSIPIWPTRSANPTPEDRPTSISSKSN
jgi:hypothetical protein